MKDGDAIFYFYQAEEQGDSFYDDGSGYMDYDIDFDIFDASDQALANTVSDLGGDYTYGAGRNG